MWISEIGIFSKLGVSQSGSPLAVVCRGGQTTGRSDGDWSAAAVDRLAALQKPGAITDCRTPRGTAIGAAQWPFDRDSFKPWLPAYLLEQEPKDRQSFPLIWKIGTFYSQFLLSLKAV